MTVVRVTFHFLSFAFCSSTLSLSLICNAIAADVVCSGDHHGHHGRDASSCRLLRSVSTRLILCVSRRRRLTSSSMKVRDIPVAMTNCRGSSTSIVWDTAFIGQSGSVFSGGGTFHLNAEVSNAVTLEHGTFANGSLPYDESADFISYIRLAKTGEYATFPLTTGNPYAYIFVQYIIAFSPGTANATIIQVDGFSNVLGCLNLVFTP